MNFAEVNPEYMSCIDYWKGHFISNLISDMKYKSYLELGIGAGNTWNNVQCDKKVGVDTVITGEGIINCTTDQFFKENTSTFDVIYIDADHHKDQVWRDYHSSIQCLNDNGILLFHDINPPNETSTVFTGAGDVYILWMNMCKLHDNLYSISARNANKQEDTLGIVVKNLHRFRNFSIIDYSWSDFDKDRYVYSKEIKVFDLVNVLKNSSSQGL